MNTALAYRQMTAAQRLAEGAILLVQLPVAVAVALMEEATAADLIATERGNGFRPTAAAVRRAADATATVNRLLQEAL